MIFPLKKNENLKALKVYEWRSPRGNPCIKIVKKVGEYDQEMPLSHTTDQDMVPWVRVKER